MMRSTLAAASLGFAALLTLTLSAPAASTAWNAASGNWHTPGNWTAGVPGDGDDASIGSGTVTLSSDSADLGSLTMTGGTLVFTNWGTRVMATNVTIDAATVTLPAAFTNGGMSNAVWFVCANTFTLGSNGTIDVEGRGFAKQNGPGCPHNITYFYGGAGHGGEGGQGDNAAGGPTYGDVAAPVQPGSGGEDVASSEGGGAVRIDAPGGTVTVFGTILADAGNVTGADGCGGSGGSIYITCDTFAGSPNGLLSVNGGGSYGTSSSYDGGAGAGGRIAVVYDTSSQAGQPIPGVRMQAKGSLVGWVDWVAENGTVYLPDSNFLSPVMTDQIFQDCFVIIPGFTEWRLDSLAITNCSFVLGSDDISVYVTNDIILSDATFGTFEGGSIRCANLALTSGSALKMYGGVTNSGTPEYGGRVTVTNDLSLGGGSWIYPYSQPTNGGSVCFQVGGDVTIPDGNGFNADRHGFMRGYGPGSATRIGGGYGGEGGIGRGVSYIASPYGSTVRPTQCGSGAGTGYGTYYGGGYGGGLIWIDATNGTVTLNGTLTANGQGCLTTHLSGGSGGGIYVACKQLDGSPTGLARANGGRSSSSSHAGGGGGGGRIAFVYDPTTQAGVNPGIMFEVARSTITYFTPSRHESKNGTLYLSDASFLTNVFDNGQFNELFLTLGNNFTNWTLDSLTVNEGAFVIANSNLAIVVSNDVTISSEADFGIMNGSELTCSNLVLNLDVLDGSASILRLYGSTNGTGKSYGVLLDVRNMITIPSNAVIHPYSHREDGGSPLIRVKDLQIDLGGSIDAERIGYGANEGPGYGLHHEDGGSYGGDGGGNAGRTYGSRTAPTEPGSGGGALTTISSCGAGGGLIRIEASGTVDLAGSLDADGGDGYYSSGAGGSGGGIFVKARTFKSRSTGALTAEGGSGTDSSDADGGGGGRIAVWRFEDTSTGTVATNVAGGIGIGNGNEDGEAGTIFFVTTAPAITNHPATDLTETSAGLVGELTATGFSPTVVICYWGETDGEGDTTAWGKTNNLGTTEIGMLTNSVSPLTASTVYHYRFYATNDAGHVWATPTESFATPGNVVRVNVDAGIADLAADSGKLQGTVTAGTPDPDVYVCWGPTNGGTASTSDWLHVEGVGAVLGDFSVTVSNLLANKQYFYNAFAVNTNDDTWAGGTNFTTLGPGISISDASVTEGNSGTADITFTVSLTVTSVLDVSVNYQTSDGTANSADYLSTNGTVTIPSNEMSRTVTVQVIGDTEDEFPSQNFTVVLDTPVNGSISDGSATGTITDDDAAAETNTWDGDGNWGDTGNWDKGREPRAVDHAVINSGTVLLSAPETMATLEVRNGATLTFTNWTALTASNVVIRTGGAVDLPGAFTIIDPSNRIHFVCTDMTLESGAVVDANASGYAANNGPGRGQESSYGGGAGHGGAGGMGRAAVPGGNEYGSTNAPTLPGSGGGDAAEGGDAGGAIRIDANGTVTVHGTIRANGGAATGTGGGGASGGSILINCDVLAGSADGLLQVNGGGGSSYGGGGAGGRMAINYTPASQAAAGNPGVRSTAAGGASSYRTGGDGTLYLPDTTFLSSAVTNELFRGVELHVAGLTNWTVGTLRVENAGFSFGHPGFALTVTGGLLLDNGDLGLVGNATLAAGSITLTNGSTLSVWAGATNSPGPEYGALVTAGGDLHVGAGSWVFPSADEENGGSVLFRVDGDVTVESGGGFNADRRGFRQDVGPGSGTGTGYGSGAGHGGAGGMSQTYNPGGAPYDNVSRPMLPGSGGGYNYNGFLYGGWGGGLIWIECTNGTALISGTLTANGEGALNTHGGAGSGGGITIACNTFAGSGGLLRANGANGSAGGSPSGGGRIAVIYDTAAQSGSYPDVRCQTKRGTYGNQHGRGRMSENGTTYLPDASAVSATLWNGLFSDTFLHIPGLTALSLDSLTLDDCSVTFGNEDLRVTVTNNLTLRNGSGLGLTGNAELWCRALSLQTDSSLTAISGPTNSAARTYGALVTVSRGLTMTSNCWIYPYSDMTNGGSPLFRAGTLSVDDSSGFNANGLGYQWQAGPGVGTPSWGAGGHGGKGGDGTSGIGGPANGSSNAPVNPGSGGQDDTKGGQGGGVIRLEVEGHANLDGTLTADGSRAFGVHGSGGAGGSIFLLAYRLAGGIDSILSARGGNSTSVGHNGGGGSGGRISVGVNMRGSRTLAKLEQIIPKYATVGPTQAGFLGTTNVTIGVAKYMPPDPGAAEAGTIVFFEAPHQGSLFIVR